MPPADDVLAEVINSQEDRRTGAERQRLLKRRIEFVKDKVDLKYGWRAGRRGRARRIPVLMGKVLFASGARHAGIV
jgi:hypothetical protein